MDAPSERIVAFKGWPGSGDLLLAIAARSHVVGQAGACNSALCMKELERSLINYFFHFPC